MIIYKVKLKMKSWQSITLETDENYNERVKDMGCWDSAMNSYDRKVNKAKRYLGLKFNFLIKFQEAFLGRIDNYAYV